MAAASAFCEGDAEAHNKIKEHRLVSILLQMALPWNGDDISFYSANNYLNK